MIRRTFLWLLLPALSASAGNVHLKPADTVPGYVARLLINESPFPGERGWQSEADTKATMLSILYVLDARLKEIPPGYTQQQIASVRTDDIIDVITAGGEKGQCDGFYRDGRGRFKAVPRVHQRIAYLRRIAEDGPPGRFARLLNHAQDLADAYLRGGLKEADRFARLDRIGKTKVTGRAYSWMTDRDVYHPGGNFVKIPDSYDGCLGGNRFFTLKDLEK